MASRVFTRFFHDLTYWPCFWPNMTYIRTWLRYCQYDHSEQVWWCETKTVASVVFTRFFYDMTLFLTRHDPYSYLSEILSRWSFSASLMMIGAKLWPLECSQGFSMIWSTDLVFDPTSPIFKLDRDIVNMIILSKFDDDSTKTVASGVFTRFFYDMTLFLTRHDPYSYLSKILSSWSFWAKLWPLECSQGFSMIRPTDLVFDLTWPMFELDRNIVKMIILSKFDDDWMKTLASRVFTRFFHDLTYWPCFWPDMTLFELDWDIVNMIILSKFDDDWTKTVASVVFTRFFYDMTLFLTRHDPYFYLSEILSRWSFWASLMMIGLKLWALECSQAKSWCKTHNAQMHDDRQRR